MIPSLFTFNLPLFPKFKKSVCALLLPVLFLCVHSGSLIAQTPYSINCPADIVQNNDSGVCSARVTYPTGTDNIDDPNLTIMYSKNSGAPFPAGTTRVLKQLFDQNGVVLSTCSFNVTVLDKEAPVLTNCPGDISANNTKDSCGAVVTFTLPTVSEMCTLQHKTYYYSGVSENFTVPAGVASVDADVRGAQGGHTFYNNSIYGNPGFGGLVLATIPVMAGQILHINVGSAGKDGSLFAAGAAGFNGGGNGTAAVDENNVTIFAGGGGGGASDIRTGGNSLNNRIIVAGGGGAHGIIEAGGAGGGPTGGHGQLGHAGDVNGANGTFYATGGTQTEGGTGGSNQYEDFAPNGTLGNGGDGAINTIGGGGGGGYYGGGGGSFGAGAGGSSYIYPGATNISDIQDAQDLDGMVTFTYTQPAQLVQTAGLPSGSLFPVGETINTFTATDPAGNTSVCTFKVTVTDNQKPIITAPSNISVFAANNNCAATNVTLGTPVTADNCGVANVTNDAPASFPVGTTTITWTVTDIHGNTAVAAQTVTVTDNQKPVLTVPAAQTFNTTASSYTIPALVATDNCGIASVTYTVTGATARTGSGNNASGSFNTGTSVINFTVTDIHGNVQTGSTAVNVIAAPSLNVTVADVYAVSPGGKPNTIYIGYGPSYLFLNATVTGGKAPYTYTWTKTGSVFPLSWFSIVLVYLPGEYTVTVTDSKGVTGTFKKQVQMVDVRCGNGNDKVIVCKAGKGNKKSSTDCVSDNKVDDILNSGGFLGECPQSTATTNVKAAIVEDAEVAVAKTDKVTVQEKSKITVTSLNRFGVYPNPTSGQFTVQLNNFKAAKAEVAVLSENGMTVQRRTVELTGANQSLVFNIGNLAPGIYLVKVVSDEGTQIAKIVLQH